MDARIVPRPAPSFEGGAGGRANEVLERLKPIEAGVELHFAGDLLPDLAPVHAGRLERLEAGGDDPRDGDPYGRVPDARFAAFEGDPCGADAREQAWPQKESSFDPCESSKVNCVDPDFVEVLDEQRSNVDAPGIAHCGRRRRFRGAQRRIGEARHLRQHGGIERLRRRGLELVAEPEGQARPAKALGPKGSLDESEHGEVDARVGQPDGPLDVPVAASKPEIPDREAAGPVRGRFVVVQAERLRVLVDPCAEAGAREQPIRGDVIRGQGQKGSEDENQQPSPQTWTSPGELLLQIASEVPERRTPPERAWLVTAASSRASSRGERSERRSHSGRTSF